ncbi:MAG TPA: Gfo/Idh/MocA family oxidoreductase [Roseimicrobium sp.]|nr:Gfo/Idh/MocA family oxidoreductase [Roseimicrobium sp.]
MNPPSPSPESASTRREFLKTSTTAAVAGAVVSQVSFPFVSSGQGSSAKLKIGLVGCGGRGTGAAAQALKADSNLELTAMADVFPEAIEKSFAAVSKEVDDPNKFNLKDENKFVGLDAYKKLINSGVDVVLLASPPGFRPYHLRAAVDAGKHIFTEKPMATDAPGVRSVMESVQIAKDKKLAMVAGFCWRYDYARRALFEKIHAGAIGDIRSIYGTYLTGPVKPMPPADTRPDGITDLEWMVRNWYNFTWLGGDGLVEQAIHTVDWVAWAKKDVMPAKCTAVGGRQIPANPGTTIYDHIEVNYEWEDGTRAFLAQRQIPGCHSENHLYVHGSKGAAYIQRGKVYITGDNPWKYEGPNPNMYQVEHDELFASIRSGNPINNGDRMVQSTLMGIMGRMAGYTGQEITWDMALNSKQVLVPEIKDWNTVVEVQPMAMPGKTKFI